MSFSTSSSQAARAASRNFIVSWYLDTTPRSLVGGLAKRADEASFHAVCFKRFSAHQERVHHLRAQPWRSATGPLNGDCILDGVDTADDIGGRVVRRRGHPDHGCISCVHEKLEL